MMIIKNIETYSPEYIGKVDILISGEKIISVAPDIVLNTNIGMQIIDGKNLLAFPGLIDSHVHITGGGGEGGFNTRTPELNETDMIKGGITTVIGTLGTDGISRTMENLIAKAKSIKENGFSCWIYTGNYHVPLKTLTGSIEKDIMFIEEIIGVGELAISDHRSSYPTYSELKEISTKARVAGMLSGKSGKINLHIGGGKNFLNSIFEITEKTDIPIQQFIPTHMSRNSKILEQGIIYAKKGGYIDITASTTKEILEQGEIKCSKAIKYLLKNNVPVDNITITSDGQGSLPVFDKNGNNIGLKVGKIDSIFNEIKSMVFNENINITHALKTATENPAKILKLKNKGKIEKNYDADIILIDKNDFSINYYFSKGDIKMKNKNIIYSPKIIEN